MSSLFGDFPAQPTAANTAQPTFTFPQLLTEKYRPRTIADFVGLNKPKALMLGLAAAPMSSGWLFTGASGTGKTTLAIALAATIPAQIHHIPSQQCNVARLAEVCRDCEYFPMQGCRFHIILIDEADQMSAAAQLACLSRLDGTAPLADTIWIFTCNDTTNFEPRFLSRVFQVAFSKEGISKDATALLARIWDAEAHANAIAPNFARLVKEANNNVRESIMSLQSELMLARFAVAA